MTKLNSVMTNLRLVISKYSLSDSLCLDSIGAKLGDDDVFFRHNDQDLRHTVISEDCEDNVWSQDKDSLSCHF